MMRAGAAHHTVWRLSLAVVTFALAAWTGHASAQEPQPNQVYASGTRVESSTVGVSFTIPPEWTGRFGREAPHQMVVLGSNTMEGVGVVILQSGVTAAQVIAGLNEPQDLGAGVVLRPSGQSAVRGSWIAHRYQNEAYVGRALAALGPARNSVTFFFAGPAKNERAYIALLETLGASTSFSAPVSAGALPAAPAPAGVADAWANRLSGQALNYFSRYNSGGGGGGMASHRVLHLCPNGRFAYSGQSLVTMNVPGASGSSGGRGGTRGRWSLESPTQSTAVLVLAVDGGGELRWPVRYDGEKTFLNGQRWLRERSSVCQ
jgi:hypothetical protein